MLLAGIISLTLERLNRLLLHHRLDITILAFAFPVVLILGLGLLACHYYGLNRWIVLPLSLVLTAVLLAILLALSHFQLLPLITV